MQLKLELLMWWYDTTTSIDICTILGSKNIVIEFGLVRSAEF